MRRTTHDAGLNSYIDQRLRKIFLNTFMVFSAFLLFSNLAYTQCVSNCEASCKGNINVSLNADCEAVITPSMIGLGISATCNDYYTILLTDEWGNELPSNLVTSEYVGMTLTVELTEPECGNKCWGYALIEDKFAPIISCENDTIACNELPFVDDPIIFENCSSAEPILLNEQIFPLTCDTMFTSRVVRTYTAIDEAGNEGNSCVQEIMIRRPDFTGIVWPDDRTVLNGDPLICDSFTYDENGNPSTADTGVPTLDGFPLFPVLPEFLCNSLISFTDTELPSQDCRIKKFMRLWQIREWWCTGEFEIFHLQTLEVVDNAGPIINCPQDFQIVAETDQDCTTDWVVEPPFVIYDCNETYFEVRYLLADNNGNPPVNGAYSEIGVEPFEDTYIIRDLPAGTTWLRYTVYDACGNFTNCFSEIIVVDGSDPTAICHQNQVVSLNNQGKAWLFAESVDAGSYDECGPVTIQLARMTDGCNTGDTAFGESVEFCCNDLGTTQMVILEVTDASGHTNICMVEVEVQNKVTPILSCPPNMMVDCTADYDLDNLGSQFGNAEVSANCVDNIDIVETVSANINNCGTGVITRIFTIENGDGTTQSCSQTISSSISDPFSEDDIVWPEDYEDTNTCSAADLEPGDLPAGFGFPILIGENECSLVGIEHKDQFFGFPNGEEACFKIIRTWTVIDWCQQVNGLYTRWTHDQVIKVFNTLDPEFTSSLADIEVESLNVNCSSVEVPLTVTAEDDCTPEAALNYSYKIDFFSDGTFDDFGLTNDATDDYAIGEHIIEWTVSDGCGNITRATQNFEVINAKTPTPVCINGLSEALTLMDPDGDGTFVGMAEIWAEDFDASSAASCGSDITFSFSADVTDQVRFFTCDDVGEQPIQMWVTDENGNQAFCNTFIDVQDNSDICDNIMGPRLYGELRTEMNQKISGGEVMLEGAENPMQETEEDGKFDFGEMPSGGNYMLRPALDKSPLNGVSTLDLVYIQRHVLGVSPLTSPYKMIAADINKSNSITAIDLVELRKLILGIYTELPSNTSWNFVDATFQFADQSNPFTSSWNDEYQVYDLNANMNIPFIGVKTGDVNNSVSSNISGGISTEYRSNNTLELFSELVNKGADHYTYAVTAGNYEAMIGMQGTLTLGEGAASFVEMRAGALDLTTSHYALSENGKEMSFSWAELEVNDIAEDEPLFYVIVDTQGAKVDMNMSSSRTSLEAYTENEIMNISLENRENINGDLEISLLQNRPNPWSNSTEIVFYLPETTETTIKVYDIRGSLLFKQTAHYNNGMNYLTINNSDLNATGVMTYELTTDRQTIRKKMLLIE